MSLKLICNVCRDPYLPHRHDYLEVCIDCLPNMAAQVVHDSPDTLHIDEDLINRLLLEQAIDEAQRLGQIQARGPRLWR